MPTTFAPAALLDLNGLASALPADSILAMLTALIGREVSITERNAGDPDRLVEYNGSIELVWPATDVGVLLQLSTGNVWRCTPGVVDGTEPVIAFFA